MACPYFNISCKNKVAIIMCVPCGRFIMFSGSAEVLLPAHGRKVSAQSVSAEKKTAEASAAAADDSASGQRSGQTVLAVIPQGVAFGQFGLVAPGGKRNATVVPRVANSEALFLDRRSYLDLVYEADLRTSQAIQECVQLSGICEVGPDFWTKKKQNGTYRLNPRLCRVPRLLLVFFCIFLFLLFGEGGCKRTRKHKHTHTHTRTHALGHSHTRARARTRTLVCMNTRT
jgi:hypothetical protein